MRADSKVLDVQTSPWAVAGVPSMVLLSETWLFCLASGLDYLITKHLLTGFGSAARIGQVVEANPLARFCLESWGFDGLMAFKVGLVTLVAIVCQVIARQRPDVARRLMIFATSAALLVVLYSVRLMIQHG